MMTGDKYRASLADGRATYFEGERVEDLPGHPVLGSAVDTVADCYDRLYDPAPNAESPLLGIPKNDLDVIFEFHAYASLGLRGG